MGLAFSFLGQIREIAFEMGLLAMYLRIRLFAGRSLQMEEK